MPDLLVSGHRWLSFSGESALQRRRPWTKDESLQHGFLSITALSAGPGAPPCTETDTLPEGGDLHPDLLTYLQQMQDAGQQTSSQADLQQVCQLRSVAACRHLAAEPHTPRVGVLGQQLHPVLWEASSASRLPQAPTIVLQPCHVVSD